MSSLIRANAQGNWDDGRLVTLTTSAGSNSYTCNAIQNAATALFLYNASGNDHDITVWVTVANQTAPTKVTVPGTTGNQGLASIVMVNGQTTNTVTLSMDNYQTSGTQVQAFIGSQAFPRNTSGINNQQLQENGQPQAFKKYTRFYDVPSSTWYQLSLQSDIQQFMAAQFGPGQSAVSIYCVNPGPNAQASVVQSDPKNPVPYQFVLPSPGTPQQQISTTLFGNGQQFVWINADSVQNSQEASISLQKLG